MPEYKTRFAWVPLFLITFLVTFSPIHWEASMNYDTAIRMWIITNGIGNIAHNVTHIELAPPFWHYLMNILTNVSPANPLVTVRAANYTLYVALVPLAYLLGKEIHSPLSGVIAAALIPWHPRLYAFTTRIDHYLLFAALTLLYLIILLRFYNRRDRRSLLLFATISFCYAFTHYYAVLLIACTTVASLAVVFYWQGRETFRGLFHRFSIGLTPTAVAYLLWMPSLLTQYRAFSSGVGADTPTGLAGSVDAVLGFILYYLPSQTKFVIPILAGLAAVYCLTLLRYRNPKFTSVSLATALAFLVIIATGGFYTYRHAFFLMAVIPVIVGVSIGYTLSTVSRPQKTPLATLSIVVLVVLAGLPYGIGAAALEDPTRGTDLKTATNMVETHATDDAVILSSTPWGDMILDVYHVAPSVPKKGVPVDSIHRSRIEPGTRNRMGYHPDERPEEKRYLRRVVDNRSTVVLFLAHGYGRSQEIRTQLEAWGYENETVYRTGQNGVVVYKKQ